MSIFNTAKQSVVPQVLAKTSHIAGDNLAKESLLLAYLPILLNTLKDEHIFSRLVDLSQNEGRLPLNHIWQDNERLSLVDNLSREYSIPSEDTTEILELATPLVLQNVKASAGVTPVSNYLASSNLGQVPEWATSLIPVVTAAAPTVIGASTAGETVRAEEVLVKEPKPEGSFMKALLPIIGLIILGGLAWMLLRGCQPAPAPVATPVAPSTESAPVVAPVATNLVPASLRVSLDKAGSAVYACRAEVGDGNLQSGLTNALVGAFAGANCDFDINNDYDVNMPTLNDLPTIFGLMKGVPSASAYIVSNTIRFNSTDAAALEKLVADAKAKLPNYTIEAEPVLDVVAVTKESIVAATTALDTVQDDVADLARALNLQIINFATDSADIPEENKVVLDKAAAKLVALPSARLRIIGHTDTQGSKEYNQPLSEKRAAAVRDYLINKGVPEAQLEFKGVNFEHPVADNDTEQGRFRNRRIEFVVINDGEAVAAIGNAPTSASTQAGVPSVPVADTTVAVTDATTTVMPETVTPVETVEPAPTTN